MNIEKQYTPITQSITLKMQGVTNSCNSWVWDNLNLRFQLSTISYEGQELLNKSRELPVEVYPAFSVAELGEMLAAVRYESYGFPIFNSFAYCNDFLLEYGGKWHCTFRNPRHFSNPTEGGVTEAEARGKFLIALLDAKIVTGKSLNKIIATV